MTKISCFNISHSLSLTHTHSLSLSSSSSSSSGITSHLAFEMLCCVCSEILKQQKKFRDILVIW
jgi:hypothetical protein